MKVFHYTTTTSTTLCSPLGGEEKFGIPSLGGNGKGFGGGRREFNLESSLYIAHSSILQVPFLSSSRKLGAQGRGFLARSGLGIALREA